MVLFVLHNFILQTCMCSHPVGLDVWFLVQPFVYFHTSCVQTVKALARLRGCAGSPEPSLVAYVVSTIISWAGSDNIVSVSNRMCTSWTQDCLLGFDILSRMKYFMIFSDITNHHFYKSKNICGSSRTGTSLLLALSVIHGSCMVELRLLAVCKLWTFVHLKLFWFIWATSWENLFLPYARSLISTFVICWLDDIIPPLSRSEISNL